MDLENLLGRMEKYILVCAKMAYSMEKELYSIMMVE
jgi:hypothetical protein